VLLLRSIFRDPPRIILPMLAVEALSYAIPGDQADLFLLEEVNFVLPPCHFMAIVGPSGCGKTTLLKIIAGLQTETSGRILWRGEDLAENGDLTASELGYVPQFSIAHDSLTVGECVDNAVRLRTRLTGPDLESTADEALQVTGLSALADHRVAILSGGQKRRLGLAMEWVNHPALLLCDEVTSGLDPRSASEIVVLLHELSRQSGRSIVNVTHSLEGLELYDSVLVLTGGRLAYHGPPGDIAHYFSVAEPDGIYPRLAQRDPAAWHESWQKRSGYFQQKLHPYGNATGSSITPALPPAGALTTNLTDLEPTPEKTGKPPRQQTSILSETIPRAESDPSPTALPGWFRQFRVLLARRFTLFFRDRTHFLLHLALLFGFPLLVVLFAPDGIGAMPENAGHGDLDVREAMVIQARAVEGQSRLGGLISGLVMFQVVLLTLMGANNSSREIAGERLIYEKERLAGLRPGAYLLSKVIFLSLLVACQSLWMSFFVEHFVHLPGSLTDRTQLLLLVNAAMTAVCLAISALMRSPDQASLLSIYLVGFQLPLSGAVLALPSSMEKFIQPFIAAYWSWSGQLAAMRPTDYLVAINRAIPTPVVTDPGLPLTILGFHLAAGLLFAWIGTLRQQWD
jgi:ABC-type multidrug transport system ATPase subunit